MLLINATIMDQEFQFEKTICFNCMASGSPMIWNAVVWCPKCYLKRFPEREDWVRSTMVDLDIDQIIDEIASDAVAELLNTV